MLSADEQKSDLQNFNAFLKKNGQQLFLYALAGAFIAVIVTFFIPKEYKSYGIVYPPSSTSIENSIDYPNFGYDVEADRLMQILESKDIRDSVIRKFRLREHFEIDTSNIDWYDELLKKYYKNIRLERTTSMAVLITARTKDAQLSANIVNYIIQSADYFRERVYKRNIIPAYEQALKEYTFQQTKLDSAEVNLLEHLSQNQLSSLLLLYSDAQISVDIAKLTAAAGSASPEIGAEIIHYKALSDVMREAKSRYIKIKKTLDNPIPKIFVISAAEPHYRKISPSYLFNMAVGAGLGIVIIFSLILWRQSRETV